MSGDVRPKRRWFQFSIGGVLLLTGAVAAVMAFYVNRVQRQREVVAIVKEHGGKLAYDYQQHRRAGPPGPEWARKRLGEDFFSNLISVDAPGIETDDPRLRSIGALTRLINLNLQDCTAGDDVFRCFAKLTELTRLNLGGTSLSDQALITFDGLVKLRRLDLHQTRVTDAGLQALRGMSELEQLDLAGTSISDAGIESIRHLRQLHYLNLADTQVSDASLEIFNRLPALVAVSLHGSRVTEAGIRRLKAYGTLDRPTPMVLRVLLALAERTEMTFKNQPLSDVLEYFSERHGITIFLDGKKLQSPPSSDEPRISADAKGLLFADALNSILEPLGLAYAIRHEIVVITTSPWRPKLRIEAPIAEHASSGDLLAKLDQPAKALGFDGVQFGDLILSIESQYGIKVRPDDAAFASEADVDEFLETITTMVNLEGLSRRSVLELMLEANGLDCRVQGNTLLVRPRKQKPAGQE